MDDEEFLEWVKAPWSEVHRIIGQAENVTMRINRLIARIKKNGWVEAKRPGWGGSRKAKPIESESSAVEELHADRKLSKEADLGEREGIYD